MATIGRNISFPIYNGDGTSFHDLVMKRATYDSIVMSLGDKITGDVYYKDNTLVTNQDIYIVYNGVHYTLVNPPTIVREGMTSENGELKGMTKYSFEFYHPMYQLNNFPFSDIAVTSSQGKYLSQNKTFAWIGDLYDYVDKINVNLEETVWCCEIGSSVQEVDKAKLSDVLSFNNQTIADALKTGYETWEIPYVISQLPSTDTRYSRDGKRFLITFGLPSTEIIGANNQPYVFRFGQGVGLKNNSRTPRNNKIVTRLAGYGSENNIPWGYPQIIWTGNESWNYTIDNDPTDPDSYPIYDGIVNGERVRLIKHPFTRNHLMPSIYAETVNRKVNPNAIGYDPDTVIIDYYDADDEDEFENIINPDAPSYEIHEFEDIKPELGEQYLVDVSAYDANAITLSECESMVLDYYSESNIEAEKTQLLTLYNALPNTASGSGSSGVYKYDWSIANDGDYLLVKYKSSGVNFEHKVTRQVTPDWDDSIDDDGNYKQSYFKVTLPELGFDLYACAALTEKMQINMRSGDCIGCTFDVMIDWDDYKKNFYTEDGKFDPVIGTGHPRNGTKYPDSTNDEITLIVQKDNNTFGIIMPNIYQQPTSRDKFVILGISLPLAYITDAEERLDADMIQYMKDNNVFYFDYPLKFDEDFLYRNTNILAQMKPNVIVRFEYAGIVNALYIKQMSIKYGQGVLPQYDITLTDDVEIVLNKIGQVTDEVSKLRLMMGEGGDANVAELDKRYLSKRNDDTAEGMISMTKGLYVGNNFVTGLLGEGGVMRMDNDGTTYLEVDKMYVRMRAYFDTVEVRRFLHSGGNRIASLAGMKCTRVEYINSSGNVTKDASSAVKFRCYFRANDDGNVVTNDFVVGDLAFCKETNAKVGTGVEQHGYWRAVVGVSEQPNSKGEHWIDLSKSDCLSGSDIPIAQDDIIQLGNKTDTTRQGAIIEYVGGDDAPAYQIYQGINTYNLNDKNYVRFGYDSQSGGAQAYIGNPNGSTYLWYHNVTEGGVPIQRLDIKANVIFQSPTTHQDTTIENFATIVTNDIDNIQAQIDGQIESWFFDYMPVQETDGAPANRIPLTNKEPYKTWYEADNGGTASEVTTERTKHLGDTFYDNSSGYAFRFSLNTTVTPNVFEWVVIEDSAVIKALKDAANAQDTADHKRRVFLSQPTPPYDEGDLWAQGENGDLFMCTTSRQSGNYVASDWELATKYTDDSALEAFKVDVSNNYGYLTQALNNETEITGGLLLTSLIGLRDGNQTIQSGINAILKQSLGTKSIAAWFGGAMSDKENPTYYTDNRYAKSLFRFDGSGYVADGNLKWDASGNVTIQGYSINATTLQVGGKGVATAEALANYLPLAGGTMKGDIKVDTDNSRTLGAASKRWKNIYSISAVVKNASTNNDGSFIEIGQIRLVYDHNNNALKVIKNDGTSNANFYATGTVSALGANSQGGGGTGSFEWQMLTEYDGDANHKINNNYLNDNVITTVNQTSTTGYVSNVSVGTNHTLNVTRTAFPTASSSTLGMVKVGSTLAISSGTLNLKSGIIATAGTYRSVTVDTYGRVTAGTNPTTISGYKISDAKIENGTITLGSNTITPLTSSSNIAWNKITGKPSWIGDNKPSYNFSEIGSKPTTLAGYGITDAVQSISISGDYLRQTKIDSNGNAVTSNVAHILERQYTYSYPQDKFATEGWYRVASIQSGAGGSSSLLFIDRVYNNANNEAYIFAISIAHAGSENANATITQVAGKYNTQLIDKIRVDGSNTLPYSHYIDIHIKTTTAGNTIKLTIVGAANLYNDAGIIFNPTTSKTYEVNIVNGSSTSRGHTISGTLSVGGATTLTGLLTANSNAIIRNTATNYHATYLEIGQIRFVYDHTNNAIKVIKNDGTNANFYATGTVSALGANTSGGGGTGIEMDEVWAALHTYSQATNHDIDARYLKFSSNGSGNGVANVAITNGALTVTKTNFLPLSGGKMEGALTWKNSTALPHKTETPQYFLVIEPFADDGTTKYVTLAELKTAIGTGDYLPLTGGTISNTSFAPLKIERKNTANAAGIGFYNSNGVLGYIGMTGTANGGLIRWNSSGSTSYPILDSSNYTTYAAKASYFTNDILKIANGGTGSATTSPHFVFIGASSGTAASAPSFRVLDAADIPSLPASKIGSGTLDAARLPDLSGTYVTTSTTWWGRTISNGTVSGNMSNVGTITFNKSTGNRQLIISPNSGMTMNASTGGWVMLMATKDNAGTTNLEQIGILGNADTITYSFVGGEYNTPSLVVLGSGDNIGFVGIGTKTPDSKLHVNGTLKATNAATVSTLTLSNTDGIRHLNFSRTSYNYISAPAGSDINFEFSKATLNHNDVAVSIKDTGLIILANRTLKIGNAVLSWDSINNCLKVSDGTANNTTPIGIYATGTVSALGANSGTSGGGADIDDVWAALATSDSSKLIDSSHINISVSGSGNAVTGITPSGTSITLNKGTSFLPLTGGTLTGHLTLANALCLYWKDKGGTARNAFTLSTNNNINIGYGTATAGYNTYIDGNNIYLRYSTEHTTGITIASGGGVTIAQTLTVNGNNGITAKKFVKSEGTATQFLKADGSVDESTYLKSSDAVTALGTSGNYLTWTKGNDTNNITIPYATKAAKDESGYSLKKYIHWSTAFTNDGTSGWYTVLSYSNNYLYKSAILHITTRRNNAVILIEFYNLNTPRITCLGYYGNAASATYGGFTGNLRIIKTENSSGDKYNAIVQAQFYNPTNTTASYKYCGLYGEYQSAYWSLPTTMVKDTTYAADDEDILGSWTFTAGTMASNSTCPLVNATYSLGTTAMSWLGIYGRYLRATVTNGSNNYYASIVAASTFAANRTYTIPYVANGEFVMTSGDQKITGVKTFDANTLVVDGNQVSDGVNKSTIRFSTMGDNSYKNADGTAEYAQLSGLKNCIRFDWYATAWAIGNVRGGGTDSQGFAIGYMNSGKDGVLHRFLIQPNGNILTNASITAGSEVTASSDERLKTINGVTNLTIKDIAEAPAIKFLWNDKRDEKVHIGSIAQYWENALPEAVSYDGNGIMSLNYGALALVSAITIARGLMKHEDEITKLKRENKELKERISALERRAA